MTMITHAGDRMIPIGTQLTEEQRIGAREAIEKRRKALRRCQSPEESLWLMEEIEHIDEILKHQKDPAPLVLTRPN